MARFPVSLLGAIRCPFDGGELALRQPSAATHIEHGTVACAGCGGRWLVRDGILDLLGDAPIEDRESAFERDAREKEATASRGAEEAPLSALDALEIEATLRHMGDVDGKLVLELGCGAGTYTRPLGARVRVVAVDFSWNHLVLNGQRLADPDAVALVRADVGRFRLAPNAFDMAFTTLYSNLPSAALRMSVNRLVYDALAPGARYLVSAHHQDLRRILRRSPVRERYEGSGIFFESFTPGSLRAELSPFADVRTVPIAIWLPLVSRTRSLRPVLSRALERVPVANRLGSILLGLARKASG
jgi:SAM-dependent methyltransferase